MKRCRDCKRWTKTAKDIKGLLHFPKYFQGLVIFKFSQYKFGVVGGGGGENIFQLSNLNHQIELGEKVRPILLSYPITLIPKVTLLGMDVGEKA